jgi:hypothetical protein
MFGEVHNRVPQSFVTGPTELHRVELAGGPGDRRNAGKGREALFVRESLPNVAYLGEQRGCPSPLARRTGGR